MNNNLIKVKKISAKTFRKAKHWYLGYILCQLGVLIFAVSSIFLSLNPNISAVIAFLGVFATECVRWRSDYWKSQGEWAKRQLEIADGLGVAVDSRVVADWLTTQSKGFLDDVRDDETQGSDFDSTELPGSRRLVENIQESAWWSKHLSRRMAIYLASILLAVILIAVFALSICISSLKADAIKQSGAVVQNVGGVICSVLMFIFSINLIRLLTDFMTFASEAKEILGRCDTLLNSSTVLERDACSVMHDYQTARSMAPLLPTFVWKIHGNHFREHWQDFRPKKE
jgi:hypothetical protein